MAAPLPLVAYPPLGSRQMLNPDSVRWSPRVPSEWDKSPLVFDVEFPRPFLVDTLRLALGFKLTQGSPLPAYALTVAAYNEGAWTESVTGLDLLSLIPPFASDAVGDKKHSRSLFLPITARRIRLTLTVSRAQAPAAGSVPSALVSLQLSPLGLKESSPPYERRKHLATSPSLRASLMRLLCTRDAPAELRVLALECLCTATAAESNLKFMFDPASNDFSAFLRNLYACGSACSRLAAQLLLRVASTGEAPVLDKLLQIAEEAIETADSSATLASFFSVLRAAMARAPGAAYARCVALLAGLAQKIQAIRSPVYPLLEQHYGLSGCLLETEPFDPPSSAPAAGVEGDALPWACGDRSQATWVLPKKNRVAFTHIGMDGTKPAVLDLGSLCLVNAVSLEWFSESQVQTSGVLQLECSETAAGNKWLLGNAKVEISASKKPGPKKSATVLPKGTPAPCRFLHLRPVLSRVGEVAALTVRVCV